MRASAASQSALPESSGVTAYTACLLYTSMHQAEDIIFDEWMLCPIYYYVDIYMAQQNLENLSTSPLGFKFFMNASNGTDTLKVCTGPDPDTIDPALNSAVDGGTMIDHAFEGLYTVAYGTTLVSYTHLVSRR